MGNLTGWVEVSVEECQISNSAANQTEKVVTLFLPESLRVAFGITAGLASGPTIAAAVAFALGAVEQLQLD